MDSIENIEQMNSKKTGASRRGRAGSSPAVHHAPPADAFESAEDVAGGAGHGVVTSTTPNERSRAAPFALPNISAYNRAPGVAPTVN